MAGMLIQGTAALVKGMSNPTLPLHATLTSINDIDLPRTDHTACVVKGRAYFFGGRTISRSGGIELADSDVHVVVLPTSGIESSDYQRVEGKGERPPRRWLHSAAVLGNRIYVFGGSGGDDYHPLDEDGTVWAFDADLHEWSRLAAANGSPRPAPRTGHSSVASEQPQPPQRRTDAGVAPQLPMDPAKEVPEPPGPDTFGTIIIHGGKNESGEQLNDLWAFDIASRTWAQLPDAPSFTRASPSLAMVENRLYSFADGQTNYLDLTKASFSDMGGQGDLGLEPLGPWSTLPSSPDCPKPRERSGASIVPVTLGQGRNYLLLVGGKSATGESCHDLWALQLKPEGMTAASLKDAARGAISKETREWDWEEVRYRDADNMAIQAKNPEREVLAREGVAVAKGSEVDGASLLLWGGIGADGKVKRDGLMVKFD